MKIKIDIDIIGGIFRDIIFYGSNIHADSVLEIPGGTGFNVYLGLTRLGLNVKFHGSVGVDWPFKRVAAYVKEERSGIFISRNEDAVLSVYRGANLLTSYSPIQSSILFSTLECGGETFKTYALNARKNGNLVVLDPSPIIEWQSEYLEMCDILLPNEKEYSTIVSSTSQTDRNNKDFFIKKGKSGAVYSKGDAVKCQVFVKPGGEYTLGCGDTFDAVVLYGLLTRTRKNRILEVANEVSRKASFIKGSSTAVEGAICSILNCKK